MKIIRLKLMTDAPDRVGGVEEIQIVFKAVPFQVLYLLSCISIASG